MHYHFIFWFYSRRSQTGDYQEVVTIDVKAKNVSEALKKAKEFVNDKDANLPQHEHYLLKSVVEHDDHEPKRV